MYNLYLPSLENIYISCSLRLNSIEESLWKTSKYACFSKPGNIFSIRDYTEIMSANFNLEIRSEHFWNGRSLSVEGCTIEIFNQDLNSTMELFFSFIRW